MRPTSYVFRLLSVILLTLTVLEVATAADKRRIAIVSSYHKEYLWSQDTNRGVTAAMLELGYLDNTDQGEMFFQNDYVETSRAIIKKLWMDTKRRHSRDDIKAAIGRIMAALQEFVPHIVLLGDDNATNHIGNQYIDTRVPVVFWGVNGNPLKYGLLDSLALPGHNVTGVYQAGYLLEGVVSLKKLLPHINKIGILSDDSPTGRAKAKELIRLDRDGKLPVTLEDTVVTNSFEEWKKKALTMQNRVDAIFVLNHNTLKNAEGRAVDQLEAGAWYLRNILVPDIGHEKQFVEEGILCAVDDSGFKQGYNAVWIAYRILELGDDPATIAVSAPPRGPFIVNLERARMLGLPDGFAGNPIVDQRVSKALALEKY